MELPKRGRAVITLSWEHIQTYCHIIAAGLKPAQIDCIVAISRGGLAPAAILAHMLNVRDVRTIAVSSYDDEHQQGKLEINWDATSSNLADRKTVLLVDDIVDSGRTYELLANTFPQAYYAALMFRKGTSHAPDIWGCLLSDDSWVVFPWEQPPK